MYFWGKGVLLESVNLKKNGKNLRARKFRRKSNGSCMQSLNMCDWHGSSPSKLFCSNKNWPPYYSSFIALLSSCMLVHVGLCENQGCTDSILLNRQRETQNKGDRKSPVFFTFYCLELWMWPVVPYIIYRILIRYCKQYSHICGHTYPTRKPLFVDVLISKSISAGAQCCWVRPWRPWAPE